MKEAEKPSRLSTGDCTGQRPDGGPPSCPPEGRARGSIWGPTARTWSVSSSLAREKLQRKNECLWTLTCCPFCSWPHVLSTDTVKYATPLDLARLWFTEQTYPQKHASHPDTHTGQLSGSLVLLGGFLHLRVESICCLA